MPTRPLSSSSFTLTLPSDEHWTLHHVLLHRIERELTVDDGTEVDPPPLEIYRSFETLDAGDTRFTIAQLEAIQDVLAEYHHSTTWWEIERSRLERLLHRIARVLEVNRPPRTNGG
ncbi:DUF7853 family protein [Haladaptatus sp. NG-WS-4]